MLFHSPTSIDKTYYMLATIHTMSLYGIEAIPVTVEGQPDEVIQLLSIRQSALCRSIDRHGTLLFQDAHRSAAAPP